MQKVYIVQVVGKPGYGGRFVNLDDAQRAQGILSRIHKKVRIVQERRK